MRHCKSCKLEIENNLTKCPLCGTYTEETSDIYNNDYPKVKISYLYDLINKCILFFAISTSIVSLFVNRYLASSTPWSIIAIVGVFYIYLSARLILKKGKNYGFFIMTQVVFVSVLTFVIDYFLGYLGWSVNYVIPFVIISGSIVITTISIIQPFKYKEYIIYLFIITLLGLIPLILIFSHVAKVYWTNAVCVLYSVLTVIGMLLFTHRRFKTELKRRLHF